jgi:DNA-binding MarR family transcriptional regulator
MNRRRVSKLPLDIASRTGQTCACFNLRRAARAVTQHYDEVLRPSGLRATQFTLLTVIRGRGPIAIQQLARVLVMDRTTLTRNLKPLREAGLVEIEPGSDRRVREVSLTEKGHETLLQAFPLWQQAQGDFETRLGSAQLEALLSGLSVSVDVAQQS